MKSKDQIKLEEAYISAVQKLPEIPGDITTTKPDTATAVTMHMEPAHEESSHEAEEAVAEHESEELSMAKSNLFSLFQNAKEIHDAVKGGYVLEAWMLQKIAVCADNLQGVARSVEYKVVEKGV